MRKELNFDFVGKKKIFFTISLVLIIFSILYAAIFGVLLDIQFKGGSIVTYSFTGELDNNKVASTIKSAIGEEVKVNQSFNKTTNKDNLIVTLVASKNLAMDASTKMTETLQKEYKDNQIVKVDENSVSASSGQRFLLKCLVAVAISSILLILFIWVRFRKIGGLSAGVFSVIALIHDILIIFGVFVVFRIPLNDNFMAVLLTILGYSLNDTVIIYDRMRENGLKYGNKLSISELVNKSINQSLARSIITSVTTIIAMLTVVVVAIIFGVDSIISFALPMLVGLISGSYSSICIAGPMWAMWEEHKRKKKLKA